MVLSSLLLLLALSAAAAIDPDVASRVAGMSLEEKVGSMVQLDVSVLLKDGEVDLDRVRSFARDYHIGSFLGTPFSITGKTGTIERRDIRPYSVENWRSLIDSIQSIFAEEGQVPVLYGIDSVHGANYVDNATIFPQQVGIGATFSRGLAEAMGSITAKDSRAGGLAWTFTPILDIGMQPSWPRSWETFSEDPLVATELGASVIKGVQGFPARLDDPTKIAACMKHFIGYGDSRSGHDRTPSWIPERFVREYHVPAFQAAVNAGVKTAMASFGDIGGDVVTASHRYLVELLREEMGFEGLLVTDWAEIKNLHAWHKVASTQKDASRIAMQRTSIDMSMVPLDTSFYDEVLELVAEGKVNETRVTESAERVMQLKKDLGLLEDPWIKGENTVGAPADRDAALDAIRESITLLENEGDTLPLGEGQSILLTGPMADSVGLLVGGWGAAWQGAPDSAYSYGTTIFEAMREIAAERGSPVAFEPAFATPDDDEIAQDDLQRVLKAAREADVVVLTLGESTYAEKPGDIDDMLLPGAQRTLLRALRDAEDVTVVVVLVEGRARTFDGAIEGVDAVVDAYLPGPDGGRGIAEVLFGLTNPSGRLPFTYPKSPGNRYHYFHKVSSASSFRPQWEFGRGLSYTTFEYDEFSVSPAVVANGEDATATVVVRNTGAMKGKHSVLLFVGQEYRSVSPEVKMLKAFEKVDLEPGQSATLEFAVTTDMLSFVGLDMKRTTEAGKFTLTLADGGEMSASLELRE